eukprot:COSAG01_NODE_3513_length_5984_cov_63.855905_1_plen_176_part_00
MAAVTSNPCPFLRAAKVLSVIQPVRPVAHIVGFPLLAAACFHTPTRHTFSISPPHRHLLPGSRLLVGLRTCVPLHVRPGLLRSVKAAKIRHTLCDQIPSDQSSILTDQHLRRDYDNIYIIVMQLGTMHHGQLPASISRSASAGSTSATRFFSKSKVLASRGVSGASSIAPASSAS